MKLEPVIRDLRTAENIALLKKLPKSKLAYFVKIVRQYPTGDRNDHAFYDRPFYVIMRRPVDWTGAKNDFYGTKAECVNGYTYFDKDEAERICFNRNFDFHACFLRTGNPF